MQFKTSFLTMLTKTARDMHVNYIFRTARSPDGAKFKKLSKKYMRNKASKYNSTKANLVASGHLLNELKPQKPQKIGGGSDGRTNIILTYGIKSGSTHKRNKGTIKTGELMNLHQNGTRTMPARDIAGESVLPKATRDKVVELLVNQLNINIEGALRPNKTTENL